MCSLRHAFFSSLRRNQRQNFVLFYFFMKSDRLDLTFIFCSVKSCFIFFIKWCFKYLILKFFQYNNILSLLLRIYSRNLSSSKLLLCLSLDSLKIRVLSKLFILLISIWMCVSFILNTGLKQVKNHFLLNFLYRKLSEKWNLWFCLSLVSIR